jgi:haloacetate dehalogenase
MALDQIELMSHFGFDKFAVVGHDRGGRVGHRMALDHPDRVTKLAVLDIVPTYDPLHRVTY